MALLGQLEHVNLKLREPLEAANRRNEFIYFIEDGVASVVADMKATAATEIGIVGHEGVTGLGVVHGDLESPFETFMQVEGTAMRCRTEVLQAAIAQSPALRALLLIYARAFFIQVASTALANGRSKLEERLARWLLMLGDRLGSTFHVTHEFISVMLAVRRSGVTIAIQSLEGRGLIRANRGAIHIVDRDGLIMAAEGSYGLAEEAYHRLLG